MTKLTKSGLDPEKFKAVVDGKPVELYVLTNNNGVEACITNYGGRIVTLLVPDHDEKLTDVVLGHDSIANYLADDGNFGALMGDMATALAMDVSHLTVWNIRYQSITTDIAFMADLWVMTRRCGTQSKTATAWN